jgi:hypothetical protein
MAHDQLQAVERLWRVFRPEAQTVHAGIDLHAAGTAARRQPRIQLVAVIEDRAQVRAAKRESGILDASIEDIDHRSGSERVAERQALNKSSHKEGAGTF